jgi:branched-chain amino acid transport system permease protein
MSSQRRRLVIVDGSPLHRGIQVVGVAVLVITLCVLPYVLEPFRLSQITQACIYAMVIVGLNLLSGFGGQISLGHSAFFGIGAYTTGVLVTSYDVAPPITFVVSIAACFVVGVVVAFPALRLKGIYVALVTLAVGLIFPSLISRLDQLTGGSSGLFGVTYPPPDTAYFAGFNGTVYFHYWLAVIGLALSCLVVRNLIRSRFGRSIVALRDNETPAIIMGVNRTAARALTFGTSAGIAGLAGSLFAVTTGILTPAAFSLLLMLTFLAGMVIGGASTLWGPVLGGFLIYYVPEWATSLSSINGSQNLAGIAFGVIIIVVTFTLRTGLAGLARRLLGYVVVVQPRRPRRASADVPDKNSSAPSASPPPDFPHLGNETSAQIDLDGSGVGTTDAVRNL